MLVPFCFRMHAANQPMSLNGQMEFDGNGSDDIVYDLCWHSTCGSLAMQCIGRHIWRENEGTLLCVISTLTGAERGVTLRADGPCWVCIFNEAELEQLVTINPAVGLRLIRNMATRLASGPPRRGAKLSAFDK